MTAIPLGGCSGQAGSWVWTGSPRPWLKCGSCIRRCFVASFKGPWNVFWGVPANATSLKCANAHVHVYMYVYVIYEPPRLCVCVLVVVRTDVCTWKTREVKRGR